MPPVEPTIRSRSWWRSFARSPRPATCCGSCQLTEMIAPVPARHRPLLLNRRHQRRLAASTDVAAVAAATAARAASEARLQPIAAERHVLRVAVGAASREIRGTFSTYARWGQSVSSHLVPAWND
jgi:hypothetical protein